MYTKNAGRCRLSAPEEEKYMRATTIACSIGLLFGIASIVQAQEYPSKPIRIVVPVAALGNSIANRHDGGA
jgi:hypothetical protein